MANLNVAPDAPIADDQWSDPVTDERPASSAWRDIAERTAWTVLQGVSATAIVIWYQSQSWPDLPTWALVPVTGLLAGALSAIKGKLATRFGNGTASSLKGGDEPVLAERVVAQETASGMVVAGVGLTPSSDGSNAPAGTPVVVDVPDHTEPIGDELPDVELDDQAANVDLDVPEGGVDDGTGMVLHPDGTVTGPDGKLVAPDTGRLS